MPTPSVPSGSGAPKVLVQHGDLQPVAAVDAAEAEVLLPRRRKRRAHHLTALLLSRTAEAQLGVRVARAVHVGGRQRAAGAQPHSHAVDAAVVEGGRGHHVEAQRERARVRAGERDRRQRQRQRHAPVRHHVRHHVAQRDARRRRHHARGAAAAAASLRQQRERDDRASGAAAATPRGSGGSSDGAAAQAAQVQCRRSPRDGAAARARALLLRAAARPHGDQHAAAAAAVPAALEFRGWQQQRQRRRCQRGRLQHTRRHVEHGRLLILLLGGRCAAGRCRRRLGRRALLVIADAVLRHAHLKQHLAVAAALAPERVPVFGGARAQQRRQRQL